MWSHRWTLLPARTRDDKNLSLLIILCWLRIFFSLSRNWVAVPQKIVIMKKIYCPEKLSLSSCLLFFLTYVENCWNDREYVENCRVSHVAVLINWNQIIDFFCRPALFQVCKNIFAGHKAKLWRAAFNRISFSSGWIFYEISFSSGKLRCAYEHVNVGGEKITMRQRLWNVVCGYAMQLSCLPGVHHSTIVSQVLHDDLKAVRRWVHLIPLCCSCWWLVAGLRV